jgi:hypothetical protein
MVFSWSFLFDRIELTLFDEAEGHEPHRKLFMESQINSLAKNTENYGLHTFSMRMCPQ